MELILHSAVYCVARLREGVEVGRWLDPGAGLSVVTRDRGQWTVLCPRSFATAPGRDGGIESCSRWRCLEVAGDLDFAVTGIIAGLSGLLAGADIPVYVISTYSTDYVLVSPRRVDEAVAVLRDGGHTVCLPPPAGLPPE